MTDARTRLVEAFADHREALELIAACRDLEQVVDRALAECERRAEGETTGTEQDRRMLVTFLRLARRAGELRSSGAELEDVLTLARDLPDTTSTTQLEGALVDGGTTRHRVSVDAELLAEVFAGLSRLCHKINNPLTSILGRAQILQIQAPTSDGEKVRKSVQVIEESSRRVAALVQELASLLCQGRKEFVERYDSRIGSR